MSLNLRSLILISRPRFWLYLAGPFLIGYISAVSSFAQFLSLQFGLFFLYFLVPANIFLYGINDLADEDTDQYNIKKDGYEHELHANQKQSLEYIITTYAVMTFTLAAITKNITQSGLLLLLLFLSFIYSYPPLRLKARPFFDSASNVLYIVPGIFGYFLLSGVFPPLQIILAGSFWAAAMHLFSAIPDIKADKRAHLRTTAVVLGETKSLFLCSGLWAGVMIFTFIATTSIFSLLLSIYGLLPLLCLKKHISLRAMYQIFPILNATMGFLLFWIIAVQKIL